MNTFSNYICFPCTLFAKTKFVIHSRRQLRSHIYFVISVYTSHTSALIRSRKDIPIPCRTNDSNNTNNDDIRRNGISSQQQLKAENKSSIWVGLKHSGTSCPLSHTTCGDVNVFFLGCTHSRICIHTHSHKCLHVFFIRTNVRKCVCDIVNPPGNFEQIGL